MDNIYLHHTLSTLAPTPPPPRFPPDVLLLPTAVRSTWQRQEGVRRGVTCSSGLLLARGGHMQIKPNLFPRPFHHLRFPGTSLCSPYSPSTMLGPHSPHLQLPPPHRSPYHYPQPPTSRHLHQSIENNFKPLLLNESFKLLLVNSGLLTRALQISFSMSLPSTIRGRLFRCLHLIASPASVLRVRL